MPIGQDGRAAPEIVTPRNSVVAFTHRAAQAAQQWFVHGGGDGGDWPLPLTGPGK